MAEQTYQNGPEHSGTDALCHLVLPLLIGSCEIVFPPWTKHSTRQHARQARLNQQFISLFLKWHYIFFANILLHIASCTKRLWWCYKPAQHGVRLCGKDRGVHHKARVVHNERDPLWGAHATSSFLGVFVNKHHFSRTHALKGALRAGQAAVATAGATGRDSLRPGAVGPRRATLPICKEHMTDTKAITIIRLHLW